MALTREDVLMMVPPGNVSREELEEAVDAVLKDWPLTGGSKSEADARAWAKGFFARRDAWFASRKQAA